MPKGPSLRACSLLYNMMSTTKSLIFQDSNSHYKMAPDTGHVVIRDVNRLRVLALTQTWCNCRSACADEARFEQIDGVADMGQWLALQFASNGDRTIAALCITV